MKNSPTLIIEIDSVGRVVIPKEMRAKLGLVSNARNLVTCNTVGNSLVIKKYNPACIFCASTEDIIEFHDKYVCENCKDLLKNAE